MRTASDDFAAVGLEAGELDVVDVPGAKQKRADLFKMLGRDFAVAPALRNADVGNGAEGAGGAVGFVELGVVELVLAFAELGAAGDDCLVELFGGDDAVGEELHRRVHATDVVALVFLGLKVLADDELRARAADVDDETALVGRGQRACTALEDEAGLFVAAQNADGIAERSFSLGKEFGGVRGLAQRLRADGTHLGGGKACELFVEAAQCGECLLLHLGREGSVLVEARGHANGFLPVALSDDAVAVNPADLYAEAVASKINCT